MSEFEIRVVGAPPPQKPVGPVRRFVRKIRQAAKAVLMRPRLVICAGLAGFVLFAGTPHVGWDYECRHPKRHGEPCRSYFSCGYYGVQGRRMVFPEYGETCSLVKMLSLDWQSITGGYER